MSFVRPKVGEERASEKVREGRKEPEVEPLAVGLENNLVRNNELVSAGAVGDAKVIESRFERIVGVG